MTLETNTRSYPLPRHFLPRLLILLVASTPAWAQTPKPFAQDALTALELAVGSPVQATVSARTGLVSFLSFAPHQQTLGKLPGTAPAEARARAFLDGYGPAFGIFGRESVALTRVDGTDEVGMEHVRFRQTYQGVPVTGGELTVHLRGAAVVAVNAKTVAGLETVNTVPVVSAAEATVLAASALVDGLGITDAQLSAPRLELLNKGHLGGRGFATALVWFIEARKTDLREYLWIDAVGGKLVLQFSQLADALDREVHDADDPGDGVFNSLALNLVRGEGAPATLDTDVDTAYDYSGDTYNYFFGEHGRDSYDAAGATLKSWVHFCPSAAAIDCPYANAFWNGSQMVYGEGFSEADDVVGHELTHAVTERTANLFYYMQSGALSESFSDIFGETVDQTNAGGTDTPNNARTAGNCSMFFPGGPDNSYRWLMGEDVPGFGAIRDMWNPTCFSDPGKVSDGQFVCGDDYRIDQGGVHTNSGVPNHAYALMVDGGAYNGKTVTGMGLTKAGKIQYRALANYLTSASDFLDNYNALKQSCEDLIGTAGITAANCTEVGDALDAVEMSSVWPCTPTQAAVPALCSAGQAPSLWHVNDIESSAITACPSGGVLTAWCANGSSSLLGPYATSGVQSYWGYNQPDIASISVSGATSGTLPVGALMQFNHSYGFENTGTTYWDGGQVKYSTDGGATWMEAGGLISAGATYGGTVSTGFGNPIGGEAAFVRDSFGYTASQLDLSSLAGGNFWYRFEVHTDVVIDEYGWFVDDIRIYTCSACIASRVLDATYNGLAPFYGASASIQAGSGFQVGAMESVTFEAPVVQLNNGFEALGDLTINNATCP